MLSKARAFRLSAVAAVFLVASSALVANAATSSKQSIGSCALSNPYILSGYCKAHNAWSKAKCQCAALSSGGTTVSVRQEPPKTVCQGRPFHREKPPFWKHKDKKHGPTFWHPKGKKHGPFFIGRPHKFGPPHFGLPMIGPHHFGPFNFGPFNNGPHNNGPFNNGPFNNGPHNNGPFNNGPHNNGPFNNGPFNNGPPIGGQPPFGSPVGGPPNITP